MLLVACGGGGGESSPPPAPTPNISLAPSTLDFAGIVLDNNAIQTFVIRNTGNANLILGQILRPSLPFSISSDTCSNATLTSSQACSVGVGFSPTSQGPFTATLSIPSNDPDSRTVNVNISGVGYGLNVWINHINSASCPSISADVTVTDPDPNSNNNVLLRSLLATDFTLRQNNGQPLQFTLLPNVYPAPVSLVLALDWSSSTTNVRTAIQVAANSFINQLNNVDWAAICKFNTVIEFYPPTTPLFIAGDAAGKTALNAYINGPFAGSGTALFDAVVQSIDLAEKGTTDKRAVIVLSDGEDTRSVNTLNQLIVIATQKGIPVFTIFYVDPNATTSAAVIDEHRQIMQRLARETGGQYYNAENANFIAVFQQITNVLSNKYTINYTSSTPTCTGTFNVRVDWNSLYGQDSRTLP